MRCGKHKTYVFVIFLIGLLATSCGNSPMPFDKQKWMASEEIDGIGYIVDNSRYRMMLWLEKNYSFCGKHLDEIMDMFGEAYGESTPGGRRREILREKKLVMVTKQHNPNFIMGIDPWIDTDWIELHFRPSGYVTKAVVIHSKNGQVSERVICVEQ